VIINILNPVLTLVFQEERLGIAAFALPEAVNRQLNQAMITGQDANLELQAGVNEQLKSRMEGQIRSMALLVPGVGDIEPVVKLEANGSIQEVNLLVKAGSTNINPLEEKIPAFASRIANKENADLERKLREWVSSYYEVSPERVNINWH